MMLVPRVKQRSFGLGFAIIGFTLALASAIFLTSIPLVLRVLYGASAFLPMMCLLNDAGIRRIAALFLITSVSGLTCLSFDILFTAFGVTLLTFALTILSLKDAKRMRPMVSRSHKDISACIVTLAGAAIATAATADLHPFEMIGEMMMAAGFATLLSGLNCQNDMSIESALITLLRCGIALTTAAGLLKLHHIAALQEVVIAISLVSATLLFLKSCPTINLCGSFIAISTVLPHLSGPMMMFIMAFCLAENTSAPRYADRWMESFLPPSPIVPATLALFWAMNAISAAYGAALVIIVLGQFALRRPVWPLRTEWRKRVNLWLLLALGLISPLFIAGNVFSSGVGP